MTAGEAADIAIAWIRANLNFKGECPRVSFPEEADHHGRNVYEVVIENPSAGRVRILQNGEVMRLLD